MKAVLFSAILIGFAATQNVANWDARNLFCTVANETTACAGLTDACCGSITTKVGTAAATTINRCISRRLAESIPATWYGATAAANTTVNYACLNTTRPTGYTAYTNCVNDTSCSSGSCCANFNYTVGTRANVNLTTTQCIPGSVGSNPGSLSNFYWTTSPSLGDISTQALCTAALNTNFYSNAVLLKSTVALVFAGLLSLAF